MRKYLIGLVLGIVIAIPVGVFADRVVVTPWANNIYQAGDGSIQVDVFDDAGNKCYVAYQHRDSNYADQQPSISCIGRSQL